jgi:hypothetical protein
MLIPPETAAVTAEFAVLVNNSMAGNQDRNAVRSVRVANGTLPRRRADTPRQFLVRARLAVGDSKQFVPNTYLKRRSRVDERERELMQFSSKIRIQLIRQFHKMFILAWNDGA